MLHLLLPTPEQPVSALTHLIFGFIALYGRRQWLLQNADQPHRLSYIQLYTSSVVFLFFASGIFHYMPNPSVLRSFFHRLDHLAIFIFFGATVTLAHRIFLPNLWRGRFLPTVWALVVVGIIIRLSFFQTLTATYGLISYFFIFSICVVSVGYLVGRFGIIRTWPILAGTALLAGSSWVERMHWPVIIPDWVAHHEVFHVLIGAAIWLQWNFFRSCPSWMSEVEQAPASMMPQGWPPNQQMS